MTGKLIFFDIDKTIWDRQNNIPESTVTAVRQLREAGHRISCAAGGPEDIYSQRSSWT